MITPTERVVAEIAEERSRQMTSEGWTTSHDDQHCDGELAQAGAVYALAGGGVVRLAFNAELNETVPQDWPWAQAWWKPKDKRRNLVRAAALIVAEIERLDRAKASEELDTCEPCGAKFPFEQGTSSVDGVSMCPACTQAMRECIAACQHQPQPYEEGEPGETYCPKCGGVFHAPEAPHG